MEYSANWHQNHNQRTQFHKLHHIFSWNDELHCVLPNFLFIKTNGMRSLMRTYGYSQFSLPGFIIFCTNLVRDVCNIIDNSKCVICMWKRHTRATSIFSIKWKAHCRCDLFQTEVRYIQEVSQSYKMKRIQKSLQQSASNVHLQPI